MNTPRFLSVVLLTLACLMVACGLSDQVFHRGAVGLLFKGLGQGHALGRVAPEDGAGEHVGFEVKAHSGWPGKPRSRFWLDTRPAYGTENAVYRLGGHRTVAGPDPDRPETPGSWTSPLGHPDWSL
jgi:hypothetical protein